VTAALQARRAQEFDLSLLDILACPNCLGELAYDEGHLRCASCGCRYPIREGGVPALHAQASEASA
jgi:uncharacterized protein YbaR (Trm112 family)